jgi:hypothetical protein
MRDQGFSVKGGYPGDMIEETLGVRLKRSR